MRMSFTSFCPLLSVLIIITPAVFVLYRQFLDYAYSHEYLFEYFLKYVQEYTWEYFLLVLPG